ncbi:MAG TPA: glycoside hydrolase family 3 N-terminal domain-containing protein [Lachnospiraceae bacterium]|nr:glycoside hydrolase family 3 N-terminal domain-containing protein [Lachnospiraceae bacterium]
MEKYENVKVSAEERAEDLLSKLTLEEKMGQVRCVFAMPGKMEAVEAICKNGIGEISTLFMRSLGTLEEAVAFQKKFQKMAIEKSPHHIPAIFHMEGLCGAFLQGAASFPSGTGRASSWDPQLEKQLARIAARQERALGITHVLAPVLDISRDSRMGRQGETYGEDPTLAAAMGAAFTEGVQEGTLQGRRCESVAKHFLGFHNSMGGIHGAASYTPRRLLEEIYGKPFQAAIKEAGLKGVMPCYDSFDGEPASTSKELLTRLLREEMGFEGAVVGDYSAASNAHKVQKQYETMEEAGFHAMAAGLDNEMPMPETFNAGLEAEFRNGKRDIRVLDRAVRRILTAKFRMGLFENPYALDGDELKREFFCAEDRKLILKSAEESLVLLKNNGVLPIKKNVRKIALIGCHADKPSAFFGGYTHVSMEEATKAAANSLAGIGEAAGGNSEKVKYVPGTPIESDESEKFEQVVRHIKPECRSLLEEMKSEFPDCEIIYSYGYPIAGADDSHFEEALKAVQEADIAVLTLGGKHGSCSVASMGEGVDGTDINLPPCQDEFIRRAAGFGKPLVGVHFNGRPISSDAADQYLDAILEAWNPSEAGAEAVTHILTGQVNPSGKMPLSVAYNAGQIPIYYNHPNGSSYHQGESIGFANYVDMPHTPRYFFGTGLSYTSFFYSDLALSGKEILPGSCVDISFKLANTGKVKGCETAQLYIRDVYASEVRPAMELAGFARVELEPGEEKKVNFRLGMSQLAFLDEDYRWKIEAGRIDVMVGTSSDEILLTGSFRITEDAFIEGRDRAFYAESEITAAEIS